MSLEEVDKREEMLRRGGGGRGGEDAGREPRHEKEGHY